ncbi:MAG: arylsulfatase [Planctomycetaceae bacterium]|nr:arylsulfatase [Planctomycetaceae bacterium]
MSGFIHARCPGPMAVGSQFHKIAGWLILAILLLGRVLSATAAETPVHPNVLLIMADDLGYGEVGCYGQKRIQTPNVDKLASQGMRFTQAYAGCHVCQPSRSVLMTGLHMGHTPVRANDTRQYLLPEDVTVAELLQEAGYETAGFGKWGLGYEGTPGHPNQQGFDLFVGQYLQVHAHFHYPFWMWKNEEKVYLEENRRGRNTYANDFMHEAALNFIIENRDGPFFAYLPYIIPHVELVVPEESEQPYRGKFPKRVILDPRKDYLGSEDGLATFAGMVSHLDGYVGDVIALLNVLGIAENTILIFTSDNGGQNGGQDQGWTKMTDYFAGNGPLRGYKGTFYEGGLRVPFIVRWPAKVKAGTESDLMIGFQDVLPTLCEVAGVAVPDNIDGHSLIPTLTDSGEQTRHEGLYWEYAFRQGIGRAARMGDWKIVQPNPNRDPELYNLKRDIGETDDIAAQHPDRVEEMVKFMDNAHEPQRPHPGPGIKTGVRDYVAGPWLSSEN